MTVHMVFLHSLVKMSLTERGSFSVILKKFLSHRSEVTFLKPWQCCENRMITIPVHPLEDHLQAA